jgi:16S rRNA (adenine1518-N6/adenine1519-N6)-dimethyltransferase
MKTELNTHIPLKKKYGQHFLRDHGIVDRIATGVPLTATSNVFEIGCGDGFLTREILKHPLARLWTFEIDPDWAKYVRNTIKDARLTVIEDNILDIDFARFEPHAPWILLANLPYQITFPILYRLHEYRHLMQEGIIMIQEEVAQKIVKSSGRGYGFPSLFFQHFFEWRVLEKIAPGAFVPPPKVFSRLLHFKPKKNVAPIPHEREFWKFIKICFHQPRRTLRNNLGASHFDLTKLSDEMLALRAQQMNMDDLLKVWAVLYNADS